jgi:hypothetical protein
MNSACIVCIAGGLEGLRPSKKNPRMHTLLQEAMLLCQLFNKQLAQYLRNGSWLLFLDEVPCPC